MFLTKAMIDAGAEVLVSNGEAARHMAAMVWDAMVDAQSSRPRVQVQFRVTAEDKALIDEAVRVAGQGQNEFLLEAVMNRLRSMGLLKEGT